MLNLPRRRWDIHSEYDSVTIVPTSHKHPDSGYRMMAIVGHHERGPSEIAAECDVIDWEREDGMEAAIVKNEMDPTTNLLRIWGHTCRFRVGNSLSTTDITIIRRRAAK